jgi:exodeoxyribonuclease V alpha subunit
MTTQRSETDSTLVLSAHGLLREFNRAAVLTAADVHAAVSVAQLCGEPDDRVRLAMAVAVRALRTGSVCVDLRTVATDVFDAAEEQIDVADLPWPEPEEWVAACERSVMVAVGPDADDGRPMRLASELLYLQRYWQQEELVRVQLATRARELPPVDEDRLQAALARLFPGEDLSPGEPDLQALAAAVSACTAVSVIAGGPGTGKTTTVARLLALLRDQPGPAARVALAAPTGKAAARLSGAVAEARTRLELADADRVGDLTASTLHRLLGWVPESRGRFRHHARNHLPYDVVIVDEMSMVSLTMMARLLEAVRPDARLVLVGDPDQLSSVEAGVVLADVVGAASADARLAARLARLGLDPQPASPGAPAAASRVVRLWHTWRFGGAIDALARAVRTSNADEVVRVLRDGGDEVRFVEINPEQPSLTSYEQLKAEVQNAGRQARAAALEGDAVGALAGLDQHRLLCAHRRGPYGVTRWSVEAERWLSEALPGLVEEGEWYAGRPLLVTANDYELGLFNGDTGVVVATPAGRRAAFARGAEAALFAPVRLDTVQTVHAMTVHRAQGSQFRCVSFVVPPADSPLLTRELLYTATSRATHRVQVFGTEEAVRRAVLRPANRASGLGNRLT